MHRHIDGLPWLTFGRYFSPEPASGGTGGGNDNGGGKGTADNGGGSSEDSDDSDESEDSENEDEKPVYSKKKMTDIVSKRLNDAKAKWERDLQNQRDTENNNFKGLYETATKDLDALKPKAELADKLVELTNANIDDETKNWPEEVKDMDPGKDNVEARLAWLPKGRKLVSKIEENKNSKGIDGEHGPRGKGKSEVDKVINNIQNPAKYAIPGQPK